MDFFKERILQAIGNKIAVMPIFGDAESIARAFLLLKAVKSQKAYFIHIDHGMLRKGESDEIYRLLSSIGAKNIIKIDAANDFSTAVANNGKIIGPISSCCDPKEKRALMLFAYNKVFEKAVSELDNTVVLGSHGIGEELFELDSEKTDSIIKSLNLSSFILNQKFPFPALAVRILCHETSVAVTTERRNALASIVSQYSKDSLSSKLLPIRSVGIANGERSYNTVALISGIGENSDFKTIQSTSNAICQNLPYVNRVLARIDSNKSPVLCHDRTVHISKETVSIVQKADSVVASMLENCGATQYFAVLIPLVTDKSKKCSVAIRAVFTKDFKTAKAGIPDTDFSKDLLFATAKKIKEELCDEVDMIMYDITSKPPAAIEFE